MPSDVAILTGQGAAVLADMYTREITSAHVHEANLTEMLELTANQLIRNVNKAFLAVTGEGSTVQ